TRPRARSELPLRPCRRYGQHRAAGRPADPGTAWTPTPLLCWRPRLGARTPGRPYRRLVPGPLACPHQRPGRRAAQGEEDGETPQHSRLAQAAAFAAGTASACHRRANRPPLAPLQPRLPQITLTDRIAVPLARSTDKIAVLLAPRCTDKITGLQHGGVRRPLPRCRAPLSELGEGVQQKARFNRRCWLFRSEPQGTMARAACLSLYQVALISV